MAKLWVAGEAREVSHSVTVRAPWGGAALGDVGLADAAVVEEAVSRAHAAFDRSWRLPSHVRRDFIARVVDGIGARRERFAETLCRESGKPIRFAREEVSRALMTFTLAAEESARFFGEALRLDGQPKGAGMVGLCAWVPVGPVLAITPFNFPLNLVAHKLAPAFALGAPVVLKPARQTPLTALLLAEVVAEAQRATEGIPPEILSVLPCENDVAEAMVRDPRLAALSFTGSDSVGWRLRELAGRKRVTLELGGNAALIIADDADLERAIEDSVGGAFAYAGQVCIKVQRVYAQRRHYDRVRDALVEGAKKTPVGDPMDPATRCGPMIDEAAAKRVRRWLDEAEAAGAKVLCGGARDGNKLTPAVVEGAREGMKLHDDEVFGPVVTVHAFDDIDEAVAAVNAGRYGLQAGVFTASLDVARRAFWGLKVGGVIVNAAPTFRVDAMPYGGVKDSGAGREGVRYAMEDLCERRLLALGGFGP